MIASRNNNRFLGQLLFLVILIGTAVIVFNQLKGFIGSFLGAITLYLAMRNVFFYFVEKRHWKAWFASLFLVFVSMSVLLGFGYWIYRIIYIEAQSFSFDALKLLDGLENTVNRINEFFEKEIISDSFIADSKGVLMSIATSVLNTTYNVVANLFMMIVILYFMFAKAREMEETIMNYFPFKGESLRMIKLEIKNMIRGNAIGIPLIMFIQGFLSALGYWAFGINGVVFWAFMTAIFGLLPIVGTAAIWLPLGLYQIANDHTLMGLLIIAYGAVIVANSDNVIRMLLMKKMAGTHPLITILGVMLGIPLFGFWGIIFGPLMIAGFLLLIKIYYMEYGVTKMES